ncbi:MAG: dynamin family protein [Actinomycetota bacterium]|nr:dynamin family protein [Actinomycetota bacterium]
MPITTPPSSRPVGIQVQDLVRAVWATATQADMTDLADRLKADAMRPLEGPPTVVVAGETKRGKSSLINALLGQPDASPVDVDIATSTQLQFRHGPATAARVHLLADEPPRVVPLDEVGGWATVAGNPGNQAGVQKVEIMLPAPLLHGMVLVDTPGVGGLLAGHADVVLATLRRAAALLFVLDANAPLSGPELTFLQRATERIETVVFAVTKIDLFPGWSRIIEHNRDLLAAHAPRYASCPMLGVSSTKALKAAEMPDPTRAARVRTSSGIPKLEQVLMSTVTGRAEILGLANAARASRAVLGVVHQRLAEQVRVAAADPALRTALEQEQARLKELSREDKTWAPRLNHEFSKTRLELVAEINRSVAEMRRLYEARIAKASSRKDLALIASELDGDLNGLSVRIGEGLATRFKALAASLAGDAIEQSPLSWDDIAEDLNPVRSGQYAGLQEERSQTLLRGLFNLSSGLMLGNMLNSVLPWIGPLIGLGLGAVKSHNGQVDVAKVDLRTWVRTRMEEVIAELRSALEVSVSEAQFLLSEAMRAYITRRSEEIQAALDAHKRALAEDQETRARTKAIAEQRLAGVRKLTAAAEELLTVLRTGRPAVPVPNPA